jgi:dTDP-L-rhamnose 4-epimerase
MGCVLITGGAGFIGSHLADELLLHGYRVRALDSLSAQVHGSDQKRPSYLAPEVELVRGDVRDPEAVKTALKGVDTVFHLAASVGVGQSMYQIEKYTSVNSVGTAVLLEALAAAGVGKLVVASSMSVYGEGLLRDCRGILYDSARRSLEQLKAGKWELLDDDGVPLVPEPTPETKDPSLASIYALTKYVQERMCFIFGSAYKIPVVALRFFNVYGTRQALSNPYTGVLAIFASRLLNGKSPRIYEDGLQQRDFVSVRDVAAACRLAMERGAADTVYNIGSGTSVTILEIAATLARLLKRDEIEIELTGHYRAGDIRHCFADISTARAGLGYEPGVILEEGLVELAQWLEGQAALDLVPKAHEELAARGLTI